MKHRDFAYDSIIVVIIYCCDLILTFQQMSVQLYAPSYMQKTCDVAEKAILAKKKLRKKCVNRDKM